MMVDAERAIQLLREGQVVAVPTETVYGLAADALNPAAIAAVFDVKNRPADNPLICHFSSPAQVKRYVIEIPATTEKLMNHYAPGPISFMLDLPDDSPLTFATCGSTRVLARIPDHPVVLHIIAGLDRPLAAPSANTSGKVSPTSATMVEQDLGTRIAGTVDGGECRVGIESTIVDARSKREVVILRHGAIGEKEIRAVLPDVIIRDVKPDERGVTPGSRYRHYAPDTQIFLATSFKEVSHERQIALLLTDEQLVEIDPAAKEKFLNHRNHFVTLGSLSNLDDLARKFYSAIGSIDRLGVAKAFFLKAAFGNASLGKALQTRINKIVSH